MWSQVDRLGEHALPTLMKKVARHAVSALALEWVGPGEPGSGSANSGSTLAVIAKRTGAKDRR